MCWLTECFVDFRCFRVNNCQHSRYQQNKNIYITQIARGRIAQNLGDIMSLWIFYSLLKMAIVLGFFGGFFVCFITKSFLTYSLFPPTPALSTISRPLSSSMCSITPETANVGSSYNRMRGPGIRCWFSDRSNCSHWSLTLTFYTDQWEPIVIYHSITFTGPYTTMQPTLLTPTTVVQGVDNHIWGFYCRRCYCTRVCWGRSSRIFHFSR